MKNYFSLPSKPRPRPKRIPPFHAVPVRIREDGWTPLRQAEFIGHLAQTRSVSAAAKAVSMARETAYRLRSREGAEGFCAAWDVAMGRLAAEETARMALRPLRKVTLKQLEWRVETGIWRVVLRQGRYLGVSQKPDNSALLTLLSRLDAFDRRG
jgi:hypothetical protein